MFAASTGVLMLATLVTPAVNGAANYGTELTGAYEYAFSKGITTMTSIDNANMYGEITRGQLAKMISNWAEKELGTKVDATKVCSFTDTNTAEGDLAAYLTKSCQMGLMGQGIDAFRPNAKVTRGEFGTTLSRALWGNKYDGATPFYANHLQALKDAGIMTRIENPSQLEIRGYVMLMLQRSSAESLINKVVNTGANNTGANTTGVVKAGDLKVTAAAATNRRIVDNAVSDLDTVTFSANENITLEKVVLERYGYSSANDIKNVWLENAEGQKVTNERGVNSKDEVSLTVSRDYRNIGKNTNLTIVVETASGSVNKTIGFKVKSVESSAKNLDLSSYTPFTYDVVKYDGSKIAVEMKGSNRRYNFSAGKMYEVARLQVKAPATAVVVKGFTLVNSGVNEMDINKYLDKVEVSVDGKAVSKLTYSVDRNDNLVISFADTTIDMKKNATFVVNASFKTLDKFGETVTLVPRDSSAVNAVEAKTLARVTIESTPTAGKVYTFNGSEVKLTNKKLAATIDAAAGSEDVVIAEGTVSVADAVDMGTFTITASTGGIDTLSLLVNNSTEDAQRTVRADGKVDFTFRGVVLEKDATVKLVADLDKDVSVRTISFTPASFGQLSFANAKYDESNERNVQNNVVGSIAISNLRVQAAKGSLSNTLTKAVDFVTRENSTRTVFEGTYTAQKQDVNLKSFAISGDRQLGNEENVTFRLLVDGTEVKTASFNSGDQNETNFFNNDIRVAQGKSVSIKVIADGYFVSGTGYAPRYNYTLGLYGEDKDGNEAGNATASFAEIRKVAASSISVADSTTVNKNDVVLRKSNLSLAKFTVKPGNNASEADLNNLTFTVTNLPAGYTADNLEVRINNVASSDLELNGTTITVPNLTETIPAAGVVVEVIAKKELPKNDYTVTLTRVNATNVTSKSTKKVVDALVRVTKFENVGGETKFTLGVEKYDDSIAVSNFKLSYHANGSVTRNADTKNTVSDGTVFGIAGDVDYQWTVNEVSYDVTENGSTTTTTIQKSDLEDYFTINGSLLRLFRA